ncbi:hypothetical protein [Argonema galeatum]|uniref:hypothetical protein n=1 Tax=Argonema galeatum TaxID=2942762 RepID=UPI00201384BA|nr:hypothetical protein [Argonema galeatum]MCL1465580.1 hypothetical protein [Argonema galeatum A003/A1]
MTKELINSRVLISFGLSLVILIASALKIFAQQQLERYPTAAELQRLREKLRQQIRRNNVGDMRTQTDKQRRESFVRDWSRFDPAVAPFLGKWSGYEEGLSVYPSNRRGRVCLIYIGIQAADFGLGTVSNGVIRTNDKAVILKEGDYLGIATVRNNQADIPVEIPYNSPTVTQAARQFAQLSANAQEVDKVVREFNAAGCRSGLPSGR